MKKGHFILVLFCFQVFISCTKEVVPVTEPEEPYVIDTVFPGPFIPAWPGSYWRLVNTTTGTDSLITTSAGWEKDYFYSPPEYADFFHDTCYVPRYGNYYLYRYGHKVGFTDAAHVQSWPLQIIFKDSLSVGDQWYISSHTVAMQIWGKIIVVNDTMTAGGNLYTDVTGVETYHYAGGPAGEPYIHRTWYARNVGLIKTTLFNSADSTFTTYELVDYFINH